MRKMALVFLCALGFGMNAYAANYKMVTESDNAKYFVDVDTVEQAGRLTKAWVTINYDTSARAPGTKFDFISDQSLFYFDCKRKRFGRTTQYLWSQPNAAGKSITTYSGKIQDIRFEPAETGTIGELLLQFVCTQPLN
ncbi:MAG: hypothetical protein LBM56_06275 [Burkholderiaceae bacterium]|jgi:hypothetical protein|nr:hypothetical protein [Burkholderiaceae bacterium]